jgi:hypothetical protein
MKPDVSIETVRAQAFWIPTDRPEADGTMSWNSTTLVLVETSDGGKVGTGYTYPSACIVDLIRDVLAPAIAGRDAFTPFHVYNVCKKVGGFSWQNLFYGAPLGAPMAICDGSVFPTVGGANPSLTIQAIACRTGDRIRELSRRGEMRTSYRSRRSGS